MTKKKPTKKPTPGAGRERRDAGLVIRELEDDLRHARRLDLALERHRCETGSHRPYERLSRDIARCVRETAEFVAYLQSETRESWSDGRVSPETVRGFARQRADIHRLLAELPLPLFAGLRLDEALIQPEQDAGSVACRVSGVDDLESALLRLPTPRLRAVRSRHGIRGHRARARVAAAIADVVHRSRTFSEFVDRRLGRDHLRRLGGLVAAGRTPLAALPSASRHDLAVPGVWTQPAPGIGGALRQVGLVFVDALDDATTEGSGTDTSGKPGSGKPGFGTVHVPEEARSAMALVLAPRIRALGSPSDQRLAELLGTLAVGEQDRQAREAACCEGLYDVPWYLPTRFARLRRSTPGPDRVVEIEVRAEGADSPVTRRLWISYQRTVGALRELIQLALAHPVQRGRVFAPPASGAPFRLWTDPSEGGHAGVRDEWATSIRDALTEFGSSLRYMGPGATFVRYGLRAVRLHAPERVAREPWVAWGEGVSTGHPYALDATQLEASLAAANLLLERI